MRKCLIFVLALFLIFTAGCGNNSKPAMPASAEDIDGPQEEYTVNIDTVKQGEITYKKLVIHNHTEYADTEESIMEQSKELLHEVSGKYDPGGYGETSIIFYKGKGMYCVVDAGSMEISYVE